MPKAPHLRARTNQKATKASLSAATPAQDAPELPNMGEGYEWHELTFATWQAAFASPMASQWLDADKHALGRWILLVDEFYKEPSAKLAAELRRQEQRFGLSPLDRVRLEWSIEPEIETRAAVTQTTAPAVSATDPRALLH